MSVFKDSASDIDELTVSVCSYISFCEDTVIPERPVKVYPNNNPCVTKALKNVLERKYGAFLQSDEAEKNERQGESSEHKLRGPSWNINISWRKN